MGVTVARVRGHAVAVAKAGGEIFLTARLKSCPPVEGQFHSLGMAPGV